MIGAKKVRIKRTWARANVEQTDMAIGEAKEMCLYEYITYHIYNYTPVWDSC